MTENRRRGIAALWIEPLKQSRIGAAFLLFNLMSACLISLVVGYFFFDVYQAMVFYFNLAQIESDQVMVKLQWPILVSAMLLITFIAATMLLAFYLTHRWFGPLQSCLRYIDKLLSGEDYEPLVLRKKDELHELAAGLNALGQYLQREHSAHQIDAHHCLDALIAGKVSLSQDVAVQPGTLDEKFAIVRHMMEVPPGAKK